MTDNLKRFLIQFRHGGKEWASEIWAEDTSAAQRKFQSLKANGEIIGPIYQAPIPGFVPLPVAKFFMTVMCAVANAWVAIKRAFTGEQPQ